MRCVFCNRTPAEVTWFIAGPDPDGHGLCQDCLTTCQKIITEARWRQETPAERYARLAPLAARHWAQRLGARP
jgi:ATP-dependent protease Clp ATPase subunit